MNRSATAVHDADPSDLVPIERVMPTSEPQREVWLADKLGVQASLAFNESVSVRLRGPVDVSALRAALGALVARHESLRATVAPNGMELLVAESADVALPVNDLRALGAQARHDSLHRAIAHAVETPFDLERGPLLRVALHVLSDDDHLLLMTAHHIVCDGWSWGVIGDDLGALYAERVGAGPGLEPAVSYADYLAWEAAEAAGPDMAAHETYWLRRFAGASMPVLNLPTDRPRAAVRSFDSRRVDHVLDAGLAGEMRSLGARVGASAFATLFSVFAVLLHRLTRQDDLVIGVPTAGQSISGMTNLVGHCVNLLPIRMPVDAAQPFETFARQCGGALLDALDHQTLTYGTLLKKLALRRDPGRLPLVSVMFNVDQKTSVAGPVVDVAMEFTANPRHYENFELFVNVVQAGSGLRLECQYNTDLFDRSTIERWMRAYEALLRSAVGSPTRTLDRLQWVCAQDWDALCALQPVRAAGAESDLMHSGFVRQCGSTPHRVALRHEDLQLSYLRLDQRSNQLARLLRMRGIGRGQRVGLCLRRGIDMVVALLAVLKAGGTYVPLDPDFPRARLAHCAADAQLALLLTESAIGAAPRAWRADAEGRVVDLDQDRDWLDGSPDPLPAGPQDAAAHDPAYLIYTSGSTGKPKGVRVPHRAVANFLFAMRNEPGIGPDDRLAAVTTFSFDIAVLELMLPLTVGAQTVIVPRDVAMDGDRLCALLASSGATIMQATPGTWRMLLDSGWSGGPRFKALVGGESLPLDLALRLLGCTGQLWNMYGPTETTVWSSAWHVSREAITQHGVSIGRPIANTTIWILDEHQQPCPIGVPGEVCIGGDGVGLGYVGDAELDAERFFADPFNPDEGASLYRTGDLGRWRNDGCLEHLGRLDNQVKVRGYRIELGEIEANCSEFAGVAQSAVVVREDHPGDVRLVAYLTQARGMHFDEDGLRAHLRVKLPEYMVPQHVVLLDAMPSLPNGKVDRRALLALEPSRPPTVATRVRPRDDVERAVLAAIEAVLNLPGLGVHDDFFALGGHSLLAARLTSRLNREFGLSLSLATLFESPTAEKLSLAVARARQSAAPGREPIRAVPARRTAPLTLSQERIVFLEELQPGRVLYNTPSAHRLTGPMDVAKFELALRAIVQRQPALRTCIGRDADGDGQVQLIAPSVRFDFPCHDLSSLPQAEREAQLMRRMQAIVDAPLDIHSAPLFRAALYKLAENEHAFLFMPHHLVWDGWSFDLLYDEMAAIYGALLDGRANPLPALSITYGDYAQWHAQWMLGPECDAQLRYWKSVYARSPMPTAPRPDRPRRIGMSGAGGTRTVHLDKHLTERLRDIARHADATLNMLALAIYAAMMTSVTGATSIVIGIPVRGRLMADVEPVMGFFNNLLPVPLEVDPEREVMQLVGDVKQTLLSALTHQDIPFERLATEPEFAARSQKVGVYQALFSFQDARDRKRQWGALRQQAIPLFQKSATEDLGLWLMEVPDGLDGGFTYNADLYTIQTADALRERYVELLNVLVRSPSSTVAALTAPRDSAAASYLRRLAAAPMTVVPTQRDVLSGEGERRPSAERALARIWATLLDMDADQVAPEDNFFDLGGDSLLAMRAVEQSQRVLGFRVEARRYVYETLAQLASEQAAAPRMQGRSNRKERGVLARALAAFGLRERMD